ncbi:megakaryocyte and platelet inhibitory receptor G6b [Trichosurus vulpecula]|uniref:megakaryocyte and platelet inhibitory receptor G6b n=1 Tax=Trichosurus vulpecula TaxID=9337 RepID=UPI00186AD39B|nr:megakaryocyte and platelet inhibitory receptor G6b [Trichosurus vulpecula]
MVLALGLLLLLSGTGGNLGVLLEGRPGDRVNISCTGVSHATRWAWAPSFPACVGLLRGRRPVFWASAPGNPTPASASPFAGRLRAVDPNGIQQLELLLARGDSGTFFCTGIGGRQGYESRTLLKVLGDSAACRTPSPISGSSYPVFLYSLLGIGLALGLAGLGMAWRLRQVPNFPSLSLSRFPLSRPVRTVPGFGENSSSPHLHSMTGHIPSPHPSALPPSPPAKAPPVKTEIQNRSKEESRERGDSDVERSLLYADLDHIPLRNPRWLRTTVPTDAATIYAVVV